jgi:FkbM family methyltransferase
MKPVLSYLAPVQKVLRPILPNWTLAILKAAWAEYSFSNFKRRIVRHRYGAYEFSVELIDFDGALWFDTDYEEGVCAEIALLKRHKLVPGAKVFNAGANQCVQAMMMAKEVGPRGCVWAIEPNPHNIRAGRRNCKLNDIHNVQMIEAVVSSAPGQLWFDRSMNGHVAVSQKEFGSYLIDAVTIDDLSAKFGAPDVLYIDVEGFECEVLKGARTTLASYAPDCFVEVHLQVGLERYGGSLGEVLSFLPSSRYDLFYNDGYEGLFRQVETKTVLPEKRFYLVALSKLNADKQSSHSPPLQSR